MREMTGSKPEFRRQESWRYKRVKENWRRPRGVTSKMRKEESGFPAKVKNGYGSAASTRGLHPRGLVDQLVWREVELEKLDPKIHIVRIAADSSKGWREEAARNLNQSQGSKFSHSKPWEGRRTSSDRTARRRSGEIAARRDGRGEDGRKSRDS